MAVTMKNGVIWDVTPCGSCKNRRFSSVVITCLQTIQPYLHPKLETSLCSLAIYNPTLAPSHSPLHPKF
jgi:hypothetical protein